MLVDTHAHLNFAAFDKDRDKVIKRCLDNNIWMINVGTNYETSKKAVEIAKDYNGRVFAAIGLHPINLDTGLVKIKLDENEMAVDAYGKNLDKVFEKEFDFEKYKDLATSEKVVAIGEIGLDYWRRPKTKQKQAEFKDRQKDLLLQEIKLAQELNLPIIIHCRNAFDDLFNTLKIISNDIATARTLPKGVIHCFTGNWEQAEKFLEMGFYLGFNGIVFKTIEGIDFEANIKKTPLNKILLETDCPFLPPPPNIIRCGGLTPPNFYPEQSRRIGEERNNPLAIKIIAQHIAKIKNLPLEKIAEITTENAKKLFKI